MAGGVVMNVHYCMGKMSEVSYGYQSSQPCSRCGMESKKGCCHSESKVIKISDDQQAAKAGFDSAPPVIESLVHVISFLQGSQGNKEKDPIHFHPPPDDYGPPVFLQNRVFRI